MARLLLVPVIQSPWWQIAENAPDVSPYNNYPNHNACDFTIFQTTGGLWRLVACIRDTAFPGSTRLFHCWESATLTNTMWAPGQIANSFVTNGVPVTVTNGVFAVSITNPPLSQIEGRMQAPHCFTHNGRYYFFYNSYGAFCKISPDGVTFADYTNVYGQYNFFSMGRDVMVFNPTGSVWAAYYTTDEMAYRTAAAPEGPWSVAEYSLGVGYGNPESPFVLRYGSDYYLWQQMGVYTSTNHLNFSGAKITHMTPTWFGGYYAPEIICHAGQYYVAGYSRGIWLAKMGWELREVSDADILVLETSGATLAPTFFQTTTWYIASTTYAISNTVQTYILAQDNATLLINGLPSVGSRSNSINLAVGANLIEFDITATTGARKLYTIYLTRAANPSVLYPQVSVGLVSVVEGGTNTFGVRLASDPGKTVTVTVARVYGDADLSVIGASNLVFTSGTYATYQPVTIAAAYDADRDNGSALIQCAGPGMDRVNVLARENDQRVGILIPVDVDFGPLASTGTWNNLAAGGPGARLSNLVTRAGAPAQIALEVVQAFSAAFTNGIATGPYPASAQQDGFMVLPGATGVIAISGLNDAQTYDLTLFGSATVAQDDYRAHCRAGAVAATLDTVNNIATVATLENCAPSATGTLALDVECAGTTAFDRAALNAIMLTQRPSSGTAYFDFGPTATPGNWNNVLAATEGTAVANAIDAAGQPTGIALVITDAFYQSISNEGLNTNTLYPATAQFDCLRTSAVAGTDPFGAFELRGLNPVRAYDIALYGGAWRTGTRGSDYTVQGVTRTLSATSNLYNLALYSNVVPDSAGVVIVSMRPMTGASWSYLNVMEVRPAGGASVARSFLVDCGVPELPTPGAWNNLTSPATGALLTNMVDTNGIMTSAGIAVSNGFASAALCGVDAGNVFPASAQHDGFVLDHTKSNATLAFNGLDSNATFDVTVFGSYAAAVPDRRTRYAAGQRNAILDARNNAAASVWLGALTSQAGQITLEVSSVGTNAADFGCINLMTIDLIVPEGALATALTAALLALRGRARGRAISRPDCARAPAP